MKIPTEIITPLHLWFLENKRDLPWRKTKDPYAIWVSEIMLQQTRVDTVIPYFERFLEKLPTIHDLANEQEQDLLKLWEGLGYYSRVRNMQKAANTIVTDHGGEFPKTYEEAIKLPGIGPYTAGAILSFAYCLKYPAVDGNVLRVMSRITGSFGDISDPKIIKAMTNAITAILPEEVDVFNEAVMELGATICIPNGEPKCHLCPLSPYCEGYLQGNTDKIPVKSPKKPRKKEQKTLLLLMTHKGLWLQKRTKNVLKGLFEVPAVEGHLLVEEVEERLKSMGYAYKAITKIDGAKHVFTHLEWHMEAYLCEGDWIHPSYRENYVLYDPHMAVPSAFKKYQEYFKSV